MRYAPSRGHRAPVLGAMSFTAGYLPSVIPVPLTRISAFIVRDRGVLLLIGAGNPGDEGAILTMMREVGVRNDEVSLILVTHGHPDHYGSADALRDLTGAPIAMHSTDAGIMRQGSGGLRLPTRVLRRLAGFAGGRAPIPGSGGVEPDIIIGGPADLAAFGIRGRIIPAPGHTSDSASILVAGGTAIVSDPPSTLFPGGRSRLPFGMDDLEAARRSLYILLAYGSERIYAVHGGPWSKTDVWRWFGEKRRPGGFLDLP